MPKNFSFYQNGIIFDAKRNSACTVAFDMPSNVGIHVGPTLYQRYMSNMSYVGATLRQHVGPTMAQRANLRWANGVSNQNIPLAQRYHAIWDRHVRNYQSLAFQTPFANTDIYKCSFSPPPPPHTHTLLEIGIHLQILSFLLLKEQKTLLLNSLLL